MSSSSFTLSFIICCAQILEQNSVNGELLKPSLDVLINNIQEVIVVGDQVHLNCTNSTNARKFYLTKHEMNNVTREQDNSLFVFANANIEDTGTYTCKYSWGGEMSEASDPVDVYVKESFPPPNIFAEPRNIVQPGEDITIKCSTFYSNIIFTLYKDGSLVEEVTEDEFSYIIRNAKEKDAGQYRCTYRTKADKELQIQSTFSDALIIQIRELPKPLITWTHDPNNSTKLNITCSAPTTHRHMWFQLLNAHNVVEDEIKDIRENHATFVIEDQTQDIYFCMYRIKVGSHFADSIISDPAFIRGMSTGTMIRHVLSALILIIMGIIIVKHVQMFQVPRKDPPALPLRKRLATDSDYTDTRLDQREEPICSSDVTKGSAAELQEGVYTAICTTETSPTDSIEKL